MPSIEQRYTKFLELSIKSYEEAIEEVKANVENLEDLTKKERIRLRSLEKAKEDAVIEINHITNYGMEKDDKLNDLTDKLDSIEEKEFDNIKEIEKLKEAKEKITSKFGQMVIDKKIEKEENKLERLQKKAIKIGEKQQAILINKIQKNIFVTNLAANYEAKREVEKEILGEKIEGLDEKITSNDALKETLNDNIPDKITSKIVDIQNEWYIRKKERAVEIYNMMENNPDLSYFGATTRNAARKAIKFISDKLETAKMAFVKEDNLEEKAKVA